MAVRAQGVHGEPIPPQDLDDRHEGLAGKLAFDHLDAAVPGAHPEPVVFYLALSRGESLGFGHVLAMQLGRLDLHRRSIEGGPRPGERRHAPDEVGHLLG